MSRNGRAGGSGGDALDALGAADQSANSERIMPVSVVFDYDLLRGGQYGGFFLATDKGQGERYSVPDAPQAPEFLKRRTGWTHAFPGFHLPARTHFALVAAHRLFETEEDDEFNRGQKKRVWRFEAVAVARDVSDAETGKPALVKLTIRGTAANKLHDYMVKNVPLDRLTAAAHRIAEEAHGAGRITTEQLTFYKKQRATRQMLWMPVETVYGVHLGRNRMQVGASPFTDRPNENREGGRAPEFISRWEEITDEQLSTSLESGGLLLDRETREFCRDERVRWEEELARFVAEKYGAEGAAAGEPPAAAQEADAAGEQPQTAATATAPREPEKGRLGREIRQALQGVGLKESDPQVISRMREYGSASLDAMSPIQMQRFLEYVCSYATRGGGGQRKGAGSLPRRPETEAP